MWVLCLPIFFEPQPSQKARPLVFIIDAAHPDMKNVLNPVQLWKRDDDRLLEMVERHYSQGHEIMVLTRSRSTKGALPTTLSGILNRAKRDKKPDNIRLMTYHGSKGLEADVVFLVGDCEQLTLSDYCNQAYVQADLSMNGEALAYDDAQGDEVMRLAYVAITRAKLYCYWFMEENAAGGNGLPKASERVDTSRMFFEDFRQWRMVRFFLLVIPHPSFRPG